MLATLYRHPGEGFLGAWGTARLRLGGNSEPAVPAPETAGAES